MTMSNKAIFLFIILLLGLILSSFLGGYYSEGFTSATEPNIGVTATTTSSYGSGNNAANNVANSYDNYDHYSGSAHPTTFYGPNGGTAKLVNANGQYAITLTDSNGQTTTYMVQGADTGASTGAGAGASASTSTSASTSASTSTTNSIMSNVSNKTFYGPNGGSASVYASTNGQYAIEITLPNGTSTIYTATNSYMYNDQSAASAAADSPAAATSTAATTTATTPTTDYTNNYKNNYYNDPSLTANGGSSSSSANEDGTYDSSMPQGIPKGMIAPGQEDLYILKSEIVPPVCPACPQSGACPRKEKCPACKPCGRCPEPNYNCKLVPNYSASNQYLPTPVLNSFSTFGM